MGVADCEATAALCAKLREPLFADDVRILKQTDIGDGLYLIHVYSPLLPRGYQFSQEIVIEGDRLRLKPSQEV